MDERNFPKYALIALILVAFLAVGFALYPRSKPAPAPVVEKPVVKPEPKAEPKHEAKPEKPQRPRPMPPRTNMPSRPHPFGVSA